MKPSEVTRDQPSGHSLGCFRTVVDPRALVEYLQTLEERLAKLEAVAPPPEQLDPTKPLYVGDGAPAIKRYEPDAAEPEQ